MRTYLDFEKPIAELESKVAELKAVAGEQRSVSIEEELARLETKARDALVASVPVGRVGEPEDIWKAVQFIIECDYFNGRTIDVDGGLTM